MSDTTESTAKTETAAPAKKSKKMFIIILAVVLLLGGGGGFYFLRLRGSTDAKAKGKGEKKKASAESEESDASEEGETARKESESSAEEHSEKGAKLSSKKLLEISLPDDSEVKEVIELQPFIVNLADEGESRYLRMTVSLGLGEGAGETKPDPLFTTKVRNAMLAVLTSKLSSEILTAEGKAALRKELLRAAQTAVAEPEVHAIYITDFIVQL
jgi:flagellar protein FliL